MGGGPGGGMEQMGGMGRGGGGGMDGFHHAAGASDWASWMTVPILVFVLIGVALAAWSAYMLWRMNRRPSGAGDATGAEAVLAHRLATGDITADDFTQRIAVLRAAPASAADGDTLPNA